MFNFSKYPHCAVAVHLEIITKRMISYLDGVSPSGFRDGDYAFFNDDFATAMQDAADFVQEFAPYVIGVEFRPTVYDPLRGTTAVPTKTFAALVEGWKHVGR